MAAGSSGTSCGRSPGRRGSNLEVTGRRRNGKASQVQQALQAEVRQGALSLQVPDSDPAGVLSSARDFHELFGVTHPLPVDRRSLAASIADLTRRGSLVAVDAAAVRGGPKFSRDAIEEEVLGASRRELLRELFFSSSSPLRSKAENWFPRELRGRYDLVREADGRLAEAEGHGLEKLVGTLYEERSRKGLAGFRLTERVRGFWDRGQTEIDLVALNEEERIVRLGTCKRSATNVAPDLTNFDGHVARFLEAAPRLRDWRVERVAIATQHSPTSRQAALRAGYLAEDLSDLTRGL
jgi:hypothetical protein